MASRRMWAATSSTWRCAGGISPRRWGFIDRELRSHSFFPFPSMGKGYGDLATKWPSRSWKGVEWLGETRPSRLHPHPSYARSLREQATLSFPHRGGRGTERRKEGLSLFLWGKGSGASKRGTVPVFCCFLSGGTGGAGMGTSFVRGFRLERGLPI